MATAAAPGPSENAIAPLPPGPPGNSFFRYAFAGPEASLRRLIDGWHRYGDVVRFQVADRTLILVTHPDGVRHILQDNARNYVKGRGLQMARSLLGEGLLTSEGDFWLRQRRLVQPAFHRQRIAAFGQTMVQATRDMLDTWQPLAERGEPFNVSTELMRLTLRIVGLTLFGADVSGQAGDVYWALTTSIHHISRRVRQPGILTRFNVPVGGEADFQRAANILDTVIFEMIAQRRRAGSLGDDVLGLLLAVQDEDTGERMTDRQVRDEALTLFLAGHETTANALAWTFYLLSLHPQIAREARAEVASALGKEPARVEDISRLPYLRAVIDESMRLFPPAWVLARLATGDDEVCGYRIPGGANVLMSAFITHRHPAFWDNPEGFDPWRWLTQDGESKRRPRFAYYPFGGGPRQCIGMDFALVELQLVLATILARFDLQLVPGQQIKLEPLVTLRPRPGVWMRLKTPR